MACSRDVSENASLLTELLQPFAARAIRLLKTGFPPEVQQVGVCVLSEVLAMSSREQR